MIMDYLARRDDDSAPGSTRFCAETPQELRISLRFAQNSMPTLSGW